MGLGCCAAVYVERDTEALEALLDDVVITVNHVLRSDTLLAGALCNRHTVLVTTADEEDILALEAKVTHIDVGRYIHTCQVTDVDRAVCIWQGRCHKSSFEILFHFQLYFDFVLVYVAK